MCWILRKHENICISSSISFLNSLVTKVVKYFLVELKNQCIFLHSQYHGCWCPGDVKNFVPKSPVDDMASLVHVMAWHWTAVCDRIWGLIQYQKMSFYHDQKSHFGNKTIFQPSYLRNGESYSGRAASLYWIKAPDSISRYTAAQLRRERPNMNVIRCI